MKLNYKEFLRSWSPWHLRKRIAELQQQRTENYTGLMTECEKLKQEVERLKEERRWFIYVFELYKFIEQDEMKGDTHEQK